MGFPAFEGRSPSPLVRSRWAGGQTARLNCREMEQLASPWRPESPPTLPRLATGCQVVTALCAQAFSVSSRFALLCLPAVYSSVIFTHVLHNTEALGPQRSGLSQSLAPNALTTSLESHRARSWLPWRTALSCSQPPSRTSRLHLFLEF